MIIRYLNPFKKRIVFSLGEIDHITISSTKGRGSLGSIRIFLSEEHWKTISTMMVIMELKRLTKKLLSLGIKVETYGID